MNVNDKNLEVLGMRLHEVLEISELDLNIIKVPNGWIYNQAFYGRTKDGVEEYSITSTFVPDTKRN